MKLLIGLLGVALVAWSDLTEAAHRANFEIELMIDGEALSIRTGGNVSSGKIISQELGKYIVDLLPAIDESGNYKLTVTVSTVGNLSSIPVLRLSKSFNGSLGGPLTFEAEEKGIDAKGAFMLYSITE